MTLRDLVQKYGSEDDAALALVTARETLSVPQFSALPEAFRSAVLYAQLMLLIQVVEGVVAAIQEGTGMEKVSILDHLNKLAEKQRGGQP